MSRPTLTGMEVRAHITDWGIPSNADVVVPDAQYTFPAVDWVDDEFSKAWFDERSRVIAKYEVGAADCNDFTEECVTFAHRCHRQTPDHTEGTALAFGQFYYHPTWAKTGHAVCWFIALKDGAWAPYFYEPQTCKRITVTPEEIQTCEFAYL